MNVLLLGANGQLGRLLQATAPQHVSVRPCPRNTVDLSHPERLADAVLTEVNRGFQTQSTSSTRDEIGARSQIPAHGVDGAGDKNHSRTNRTVAWTPAAPVTVINAAAYTLVDAAEKDSAAAFAVNAASPMQLAELCRKKGWKLLHFSTDYVFDVETGDRRERIDIASISEHRSQRPFRERDPVTPVNEYARSKWAGEEAIRQTQANHLVIRTCGLYSGPFAAELAERKRLGAENAAAHFAQPASGKGNFVSTMLRLGRQNGVVRVVGDQHCTPTSALQLAIATWQLIAADVTGTIHVTNSGETTWDEFAREVFLIHNLAASVVSISSADFGAPARRPKYSVLDTSTFADTVGQPLPHWKDALKSSAAEWNDLKGS